MEVALRVLHAPKEGNSPDQYEDAFAVAQPAGDDTSVTIAVADGASSAVFAREWANLLVAHFASGTPFPAADADVARAVAALGEEWQSAVESKATSWYAQEKLPSGSSAALLVVTWNQAARTWTARSVGDVCLFLVRGNRLRYAFPVTKSAKFDDRPALLTTRPAAPCPKVSRFEAAYEPGDRFLLMTDALAQAFLTDFEAKKKPWHDLPSTEAAFTAWLKTRRDTARIKNDDVTFIDLTL